MSHHCDIFDTFVTPTWTNVSVSTWKDHSIVLNTAPCPLGVSAVRYAWSVTPCDFKKCQVYNHEGLPAAPFWYEM